MSEQIKVGNVVMLRGSDTPSPAMTVEAVGPGGGPVSVLWFDTNGDESSWELRRAQLPANTLVVTDAWEPEDDE